MDLTYSEDQTLLSESIARFIQNDYDFETRRRIAASEHGLDPAAWAQFADLGWLGIPFSEAEGGLGADPVAVMILMEQFGRGLVVEPYVPSILLGGRLIAAAGNAAQRERYLGDLIAGRTQLAFAHGEPGGRYALAHVATRAEPGSGGFTLSGQKAVVHNAAAADFLVVSARSSGEPGASEGISLFVVPRGAAGLSIRAYGTVDGLRAGEVALDGVEVGEEAQLGVPGEAFPVIERVTDTAVAAVCAEAVGIMDRSGDRWTTQTASSSGDRSDRFSPAASRVTCDRLRGCAPRWRLRAHSN